MMSVRIPQKYSVVLHDARAKTWRILRNPIQIVSTTRPDHVVACLQQVEATVLKQGLIAAGFLSYEAASAFDTALCVQSDETGFPLLWFGLYERWSTFSLEAKAADPVMVPWRANVSEEEYQRCLRRVQNYISAGDTYQVNYSYRLQADFTGEGWPLFVNLATQHQPEFGAYLNLDNWELLSLSPEQFFSRQGSKLCSLPMKGTMARGLSFADDQEQGKRLQACMKNRAENVMIVDMVRNDLGRIAQPGSVRVEELFALRRYPSLWQMVSTVSGEVNASMAEVFAALFPAASITGAPKARTMELIAELETTPRRIYTGSIGFIHPDGHAQFNVAIRTLLYDQTCKQLEYGVGGGIVADSSIGAEWQETRVKSLACQPVEPEFSLIETMRWTAQEGIFLLELHLQRLQSSALYFDYPFKRKEMHDLLLEATNACTDDCSMLRLLLQRNGEVQIETRPLPPKVLGPARLVLAREAVDQNNRFLYHKTTRREVYTQARAAAPPEADDVLLFNRQGELTETTIANLVVTLQGERYTPPVCCGLLAGTYRQYLLESELISERRLQINDLREAEAITLINSVRGERLAVYQS
ncbi:aminodeoxychorismate synthase component I [Desulfobulbus rhabdoformis]|uniref:aminodeoxychorismate synthase component I n=1 Tax=Desulfobulbus rhabdoformis TaxID=34032 RepID=UPI0019645BCC|nr:aminodeoxychorismate synthase component I [Desulfobulbus rhabdoformis]MBM9616820.1 aminodeoxychorismate synthase component I [Desulfobulbus rhabdoformis]